MWLNRFSHDVAQIINRKIITQWHTSSNQNRDNIISFPSLPTKIGILTIQLMIHCISFLTMDMLESLTVTQSDNPLWYSSRANIFTSKCGEFINRMSKPTSDFVRNTFLSTALRNVRSIAHGIAKESFARKMFMLRK